MPIVLYRVDERLIHGQVVVGWGSALRTDRIVVIDDDLAGEVWEQELYSMGLPVEIETVFVDVAHAKEHLAEWRSSASRTMLLTRDISTMLRLGSEGALTGEEVNIGGIHHAPGRREVLPYVFLNTAEENALRALVREGARVTARDLPTSREVGLDHLVEGGG
ncbi:MAG: PTS system mannose/fructose/N-acetylgalactosamine-transporter subunit IIB [Longimicrobiales bacterium]